MRHETSQGDQFEGQLQEALQNVGAEIREALAGTADPDSRVKITITDEGRVEVDTSNVSYSLVDNPTQVASLKGDLAQGVRRLFDTLRGRPSKDRVYEVTMYGKVRDQEKISIMEQAAEAAKASREQKLAILRYTQHVLDMERLTYGPGDESRFFLSEEMPSYFVLKPNLEGLDNREFQARALLFVAGQEFVNGLAEVANTLKADMSPEADYNGFKFRISLNDDKTEIKFENISATDEAWAIVEPKLRELPTQVLLEKLSKSDHSLDIEVSEGGKTEFLAKLTESTLIS